MCRFSGVFGKSCGWNLYNMDVTFGSIDYISQISRGINVNYNFLEIYK